MSEEMIEDIVAEIRRDIKLGNNYYAANLPDRIEEAAKRERTCRRSIEIPIEIKPTLESHEVLDAWIALAEWLIENAGKDALGQGIAKMVPLLRIRIDQSRAVLSRPLRNCDLYTTEAAVDVACADVRECVGCPRQDLEAPCVGCIIRWLLSPAKEGASK